MAIRLPRIPNAKLSPRRSHVTVTGSDARKSVPKGFVPVYVGETSKKMRFVVPLLFLKHTLFQKLLSVAEEEFGFEHAMGGLTLPCSEVSFLDLMRDISKLT